jgi:hypothetical protein
LTVVRQKHPTEQLAAAAAVAEDQAQLSGAVNARVESAAATFQHHNARVESAAATFQHHNAFQHL